MISPPTVCPAHRYDREEDPEERVVCLREEHVIGAWTLICRRCWETMANGLARRQEWELD